MNIPRLREVQKTILANPAQFDMSTWARNTDCGTTYCIGGWAHQFSKRDDTFDKEFDNRIPRTGVYECVLGLTLEQASELYYNRNWPEPFRINYLTQDNNNKAQVTSDFIDYFINKYQPQPEIDIEESFNRMLERVYAKV